MRKPGMILMLIALAAVCASQVEVDLTLRNKATIRVTVPEGAFQMIDNQANLFLLSENSNNSSFSEKTTAEDNVRAAWCKFECEKEYEQFRQLWDIDSSGPAQEQASLTADLFEKCLVTADYLDIQGEYAKYFFKNLVKYGLFSTHSADIVSRVVFSDRELSYDIFWSLLYAFLDQIGFKYRIIIHPSTKKKMLLIESTNAQSKKINEEYKGPTQATRMRTVLYSELGPPGTPERERNEAVFMWLLLSIGGSSVDIQYSTYISSEDTTGLSQTIKQFTKENEKGARVYVEGLELRINYRKGPFSLLPVLQRVPNLSRLELSITYAFRSNTVVSSLVNSITSCRFLKALTIIGQRLESELISTLVETLSFIEQISFFCNPLEDTAIDSLKKCTQLESLEIWGDLQLRTTVQALVSCLPSLRKLRIRCQSLDPAAAESFQECTQLESLEIWGESQTSTAMQALISCLPSLRELKLWCQPLEPAAAESFKTCTKLESLKIWGELQPSTAVQALLTHLPSLKELTIGCQPLEPAAAESFQACTQLERLKMFGESQLSTAVQALVSRLPSLRELIIEIGTVDISLANTLRKCLNLQSLNLTVDNYTPGFLAHYLQAPLPSITSLEMHSSNRNIYSEEDIKAKEDARAKGIAIDLGVLYH
ncbi:hypothetical protein NECID01_2124 [Nematocida sp. AWRm77]|nr:hypothetical protein NECID01_2124 [Nematocida sp. AWRm77]